MNIIIKNEVRLIIISPHILQAPMYTPVYLGQFDPSPALHHPIGTLHHHPMDTPYQSPMIPQTTTP